MKKFIPYFLIFVLAFSLSGTFQSAQASSSTWRVLAPKPNMVDNSLQVVLNQLSPNDMLTVIVTLDTQAELSRVNGADRAARLQGVIQALQATANGTQGRLTGLLNTYRSQGLVESFTPFWVFNGFSVTGTVEAINALAQDPDVYTITPDNIQIVPALGTPEPNISVINAPALWGQGYTGQGVVVASMDSGVDVSHPDLSARWRGGSNSWFDPYNQHSTPVDLSGHGTWTTGIMVGGDAGGTSIGVAPGAQWIAAKIFNDQGGSTATAIHQAFQWLLDPDGNPTTADAPQVVNNSWTYANPGCYLDFEPDLESLRAAGILPVFAAGNSGPYSNTSYSPSNNPSAFAVGAVNNSDQIYAYSSRGPSTCGGSTGPFPEMVAPGVNVRTTDRYGLYTTATGTSLAAPHVAGGLALLLSAYPDLDAGTQEQALINSAVDLGASGPDDVFGYGRLDLFSAFNWAATAPTSTPPPPTPTSVPSSTPTLTPTESGTEPARDSLFLPGFSA
jgi:serine protease AprX